MKIIKSMTALITAITVAACIYIPFAKSEEVGIGTAASCKMDTTEKAIPYSTTYTMDYNRYADSKDTVLQEGQNGVRQTKYRVTFENGAETGREFRGETVKQPVNKIISVPVKDHLIEVKEETKRETIPYTTLSDEIVYDNTRQRGEKDIVLRNGSDGVRVNVYTVTYTDGVETDRVLKSTSVEKNPVAKKISVASAEPKPVVSYEVVSLPNLPETEEGKRSTILDQLALQWATYMANNNLVKHNSDDEFNDAVGGWGSVDEVLHGRDSTGDNVLISLGSHGGAILQTANHWGAGCVVRKETYPDGTVHSTYFACAVNDFGAEDYYAELTRVQ